MKFVRSAALAAFLWLCTAGQVMAEALFENFEDREVAGDISFPVDFTWLPGGRMLVAQKKGLILIYDKDGDDFKNRQVSLDLSSDFCENGERGIGSVQVHPDFDQGKRYIYVYYTYKKFGNCEQNGDNGPVNRLSRFWLPEGSSQIDRNSEMKLLDTPPLAFRYHNAGKIEFGKDGYLYCTVGEGGMKDVSQNPGSLLGVMVRLTDNGDIPSDNPFANDSKGVRCNEEGLPPPNSPDGARCKEVVAIGLRNPFRIAMDPNTSGNKVRYYINDVGDSFWEEINEGGDDYLSKVPNYGYPRREGPCRKDSDSDCSPEGDYEDPIHYYRHQNGGAVTASAFVPSGVWPSEFDNTYLFGDYVFGKIYLMKDTGESECRDCNPPVSNKNIQDFASFPSPVNMRFGPYKDTMALYYSSIELGGMVRRITYTGDDNNRFPETVIDADVWIGTAPLKVNFSASKSTDEDNDNLTYEWDFNEDDDTDSWDKNPTYTFTSEGVHKVTLRVGDGKGGSDSKEVEIKVGTPPVPIMTSPPEGATFAVGDNFLMQGHAEGDPNAKLEWEVRQHHDTHWHPFLDKSEVNGETLQGAPEPEDYYAASNSHLEFLFTATNAIGLSTTVSRLVMPKKIWIDFDTEPSGLEVKLNGTLIITPGTATTWENQKLRVEVFDQVLNGALYEFSSWSNGESRSHELLIPASGVPKMTAYFTKTTNVDVGPTLPATTTVNGVDVAPTPPATGECRPELLLLADQYVTSNSAKSGNGVYLYQEPNGNLYVRKGSMENSMGLVWESQLLLPNGDYLTKLQRDGNLVTRPGTCALRSNCLFWKSGMIGEDNGEYFLALDCGGKTVSVYKGTPDNPKGTIWTSPVATTAVDDGECRPEILLLADQYVTSDSAKSGNGVYLYQETNGNLCIRKGSMETPMEVVWESQLSLPNGDYLTKLQRDGNLVTRPGTCAPGSNCLFWKSGMNGEDNGEYFLALDCGGKTVSVYKGTPDNPMGTIWTSPVGFKG